MRFQIVRSTSTDQYHVRFIAANGEIVWFTESYVDKRDAHKAIGLLPGVSLSTDGQFAGTGTDFVEIVEVTE